MTTTPEVIDLHAVPHPTAQVRRAGFPLDHPYLEECWAPVVGPSSVLFLRHCASLWRESTPARVRTEDLARQIGLGRGTGRSSPMWHTIERVVQFRFASMATPGELDIYTEVPPVPAHQLDRLPRWSRNQHDRLLGQHLDGLALSAGQAPVPSEPPPHVRMAHHLDRLTNHAATQTPTLGR